MTMVDSFEKIPLDAKLLSYAIIELNISRRNVAIYPREHPSVERSLNNAFKFLQQLFELRHEITLAIAKDTIIIDEYHLDKKNPVYRDFALTLSKMNIAYVTFKTGITKDELYRFHLLLMEETDNLTANTLKTIYKKYNLIHIEIGAVDYHKFSAGDQKHEEQPDKVSLWERYVYGLLEGTLHSGRAYDEVRDIPPEILAKILHRASENKLKEQSYDKVIASYMRNTPEHIFSGQDLQRLLECIHHLSPDLKKQFLSSAVKTFSQDIDTTGKAFKEISVEDIEGFLTVVNKQRIAMPQPLMDLINRLSHTVQDSQDTIYIGEDEFEDEEFNLSNLSDFLNEDTAAEVPESCIPAHDLQEIQNLLRCDVAGLHASHLMEFENEFNEDLIQKRLNQIILEMMYSETVSEKEYNSFVNIIKEQSEQLLWIGQFGQFLEILKVIELNKALYRFAAINSEALQYYHSPEFIMTLIDSFRILGRQNRKEVLLICGYYDQKIIPYLMDALAEEDSLIIRRFIMELIKQFGEKVVPEAVKRLSDDRWFVKRNMLYILSETDSREVISSIKPFCRDENLKVSIPAIRCLLGAGDAYATDILKEFLNSKSEDLVKQAIILSGSFKIKEVVEDLIRLLNRQEMTGDDILGKLPIVRALGDIGDPAALDAFRSLIASKSILFGKKMEQVKEEIYKVLKNYPYESVRDLVEAGLKSKNQSIREESLQFYQGKAG